MKVLSAFSARILLAALLALLVTQPVSAQSKYGIIDLKKVFDDFWKRKQADTQLKERGAEFEKQRKDLMDSYQKANEEYKKLIDSASDQALSTDERERRKKLAEDKLRDFSTLETQLNQFDRQARSILTELMTKMRENVLRQIQEVVANKAKAGGYTLVWDVASQSKNDTPIILYSSGENDLTDAVLQELNRDAPAEFLKSDSGDKTNAPPAPAAPAKKDSKKK